MLSKIQGELRISDNEDTESADVTEITETVSEVYNTEICNTEIDDIFDSYSVSSGCDTDEATNTMLETETSHSDSSSTETSKSERDTTVVYWTESGSKWHIYKDCHFLKNAAEVISGSDSEAKKAGKKGVCKTCGESLIDNSSVETSQDEPGTDTVYWTESGSKWHLYEDCGSLKNATEIMNGSISKAKEAKKKDVCKTCSKRKDKETDTAVTN